MNEQASFRIAPVRTANDLASTVRLFGAYASSLDIDLSYQGFEAEMEAMPGKYAPPAGELLLARASMLLSSIKTRGESALAVIIISIVCDAGCSVSEMSANDLALIHKEMADVFRYAKRSDRPSRA